MVPFWIVLWSVGRWGLRSRGTDPKDLISVPSWLAASAGFDKNAGAIPVDALLRHLVPIAMILLETILMFAEPVHSDRIFWRGAVFFGICVAVIMLFIVRAILSIRKKHQ